MEKGKSPKEITLDDPIVVKSRQMIAKLLKEKVIRGPDIDIDDGLIELILRGQMTDQQKKQKQQELLQSAKLQRKALGYVQSMKSSHVFDSEFQIQSAKVSPQCEYIAFGGTDGLIEVWNFNTMVLDTTRLAYQGKGHYMVHDNPSPILALDFSLDERLLVSGDQAGTIKVWKVKDGKCLR